MRRTLPLTAVVAALAIAGAACSTPSKQVTDKIQQDVQSQFKLADKPATTCPSGAQAKKGEKFTCMVTIDGQTVVVKVSFTADNKFDAQLDGSVLVTKDVEANLKKDAGATSVRCGTKALAVVTVAKPLECTVVAASGTTKVQVVLGANGKYHYKVV